MLLINTSPAYTEAPALPRLCGVLAGLLSLESRRWLVTSPRCLVVQLDFGEKAQNVEKERRKI